MSKNVIKVMGEGGVHRHAISSKPERTQKDGIHKHLFFAFDRLLMTDLSGAHWHPVNAVTGEVGTEEPIHQHHIQINTQQGLVSVETEKSNGHPHEFQTNGTTLSGVHVHVVDLAGEKFVSMIPSDLVQAIQEATKAIPALKDFKISSTEDNPLEMNFSMVKRLNQDDFKPIIKSAVVASHLKSLSRMSEGLMIESMILSRERYTDIGLARRFVMDHGLNVSSSEERDEVFVFGVMAKDKFEEPTLQRIRITDGVEAVVGFLREGEVGQQQTEQQQAVTEGSQADMLTENAVQSEAQATVLTAPSLESMKTEGKNMGLKEKLAALRARFDEPTQAVAKRAEVAPKSKALVNWKTKTPVTGTTLETLVEIAEKHGIERKFVTVEYPQKRFVEYLTEKFEVVQAAYENAADKREGGEREYASLVVKGEHINAVLYQKGYQKNLVIFFDDEEKLDEIFKTELQNYPFGVFSFKTTMFGPVLVPVEIAFEIPPIIDEEILESLKSDTEVFFSPATEEFFNNNEAGVKLIYKRGLILYGPPGNGKTTFIKAFAQDFSKGGYVVLCEPQDFSPDIGKFLKSCFGKDAKKTIVFEDVDCIHWGSRSALLNFLDGVNVVNKTLFLATSNYPERLDPALVQRPSRFDQKYKIDLPSFDMRRKFLQFFFKNLTSHELDKYADHTEGFSGAYFKELFILKGMRQCTLDKAITNLLAQMAPITKSDNSELKKSFMEVVFKAEESLAAKLAKTRALFDLPIEEAPVATTETEQKTKAYFEILKRDPVKRLITGPVLIPENIDLQDDIISAHDIEKAAHNYMIKLCFNQDAEFLKTLGLNSNSKRGFMHTEFNRKIALVESYCAPVDFELEGRKVTQGTWIWTVKVFDDEAWGLVMAKKINGFSIGGRSKVRPEVIEGE